MPPRFELPPRRVAVALVAMVGVIAVLAVIAVNIGSPSPTPSASAGSSSSSGASPSASAAEGGSPSASASTAASASASASGVASPSATVSPTAKPSPTPKLQTVAPTPVLVPTATPAPVGDPSRLTVQQVVGGLNSPLGVTNAGDGSGRLFVVQRGGQIRVIDAAGHLLAAPFVDLANRIKAGGEQGLLGLAFHPSFAANGRLFVDYTRAGDGATVISELTAAPNRASANPATERILLTIPQPYANHNGGQVAFGRDGFLYIGMGDGGSGGDPQGNGQNRQTLLGKILRISVDGASAPGKAYGIPNNNPYAPGGVAPGAGLPEIWAYGLRNPWRFSFDRANGDLYIGDVGQSAWEEIDRQGAGSRGGENYGWNAFEGKHCFTSACSAPNAVAPVAEYSHDVGCSVSGGYVYRGTRQPGLQGIYVFGDYCSGTIFTIPAGVASATPKPVSDTGLSISSFGEGQDGEIYLVDIGSGGIYRVVIAP